MAILIVVLVFAAGLLVLQRAQIRSLEIQARVDKERLAEIETLNRALDIRLKMLAKMSGELEQKLVALEGERNELNQKLKDSDKKLRELRANLETMTPDDMVQTTRRILRDSGVEKVDVGARFSLSAFRKNTGILLEWEEFSLVRIPALEKKIEILEKENLNLQNQILLWKEADQLWRKKNTLHIEESLVANRLIQSYGRQLELRKRERWYWLALGAMAGAGIHALLK